MDAHVICLIRSKIPILANHTKVDSNSRVRIRFNAPEALKVRGNCWSGPKFDMDK